MKQIKKYIDKDGNERIYSYDTKKYMEKYNKTRNGTIYKLQKRKYYYKKKGELEKVRTLDIMINIEKRREKMSKMDG